MKPHLFTCNLESRGYCKSKVFCDGKICLFHEWIDGKEKCTILLPKQERQKLVKGLKRKIKRNF